MKRFKDILFVYSGNAKANPSALKQAMHLAAANGGKLTVLTVLKKLSEGWHYKIPLERYLKEEVEKDVATAVADLGDATSLEPEITFTSGETFIQVIGRVLSEGHDLVVKAVENASDRPSLGFPTTDMHLLRKCPCPLWLFKRPVEEHEELRVLAAIDPPMERSAEDEMTRMTLQLGTSLTAMFDHASLEVFHCWELPYEDTLRNSPFIRASEEEIEEQIGEERASHRQAIAEATASFNSEFDFKIDLTKGNPTEILPSRVSERGINLIVMGTVGRTGIQGLFIGNTAETVLSRVDCSVLAVKPEGFETPVKPAAAVLPAALPVT